MGDFTAALALTAGASVLDGVMGSQAAEKASKQQADAARYAANIQRQMFQEGQAQDLALYRPSSLTLLVSPSLRQLSELFAKVVGFLQRVEPRPSRDEDDRLSRILDTGSRVVGLPSAADKIRGFSAVDLLIEDEAEF